MNLSNAAPRAEGVRRAVKLVTGHGGLVHPRPPQQEGHIEAIEKTTALYKKHQKEARALTEEQFAEVDAQTEREKQRWDRLGNRHRKQWVALEANQKLERHALDSELAGLQEDSRAVP